MQIEVWSDVLCPWCYLGKRHLEQALSKFDHAGEVEVTWRSFELDPGAPPDGGDQYSAVARKYGRSPDQVAQMMQQMEQRAAADGLEYHLDIAQHGNSFDAHRLLHLAHNHGRQDQLKERLFRAVFTDGEKVGDHATLRRLAVETGLPADEIDRVLAGDEFAADVRDDEQQAGAYGINGVPFFVFDAKFGVSGAQPADVLLQVMDQAWAERSPLTLIQPEPTSTDGGDAAANCDGASCAV